MQIVADLQHAILAFVDACNRNHYEPTVAEVTAWLESPRPRDAVYETDQGEKSSPSPSDWARQLSKLLAARREYHDVGRQLSRYLILDTSSWTSRWSALASNLLREEGQVMVEPAESAIEHLMRIGWLKFLSDASGNDDKRLEISPIGRALLREAEIGKAEDEHVSVVMLRRDDVLAYPQLVGLLARMGDGLLVDPYLRLEHLHDLVISTQLTRLLVGQPKPQDRHRQADLASMGTYLASPQLARKIEVRVSEKVHDRVVISASGEAFTLGTSLNGVGQRSTTVFSPLPASAAVAMRDEYEAIWRGATPISAPEQRTTSLPNRRA